MLRQIKKAVMALVYFFGGFLISVFLPVEFRYLFGYTFAIVVGWAWRVMTKEEVNNG
jgi:hypothetical protein